MAATNGDDGWKELLAGLLESKRRRVMWANASDLIRRVCEVLPVKRIVVLGSFTTDKPRPADVDFIVLLGMEGDWDADVVFVPDNEHGRSVEGDARKWMAEKYGEGNFEVVELPVYPDGSVEKESPP